MIFQIQKKWYDSSMIWPFATEPFASLQCHITPNCTFHFSFFVHRRRYESNFSNGNKRSCNLDAYNLQHSIFIFYCLIESNHLMWKNKTMNFAESHKISGKKFVLLTSLTLYWMNLIIEVLKSFVSFFWHIVCNDGLLICMNVKAIL